MSDDPISSDDGWGKPPYKNAFLMEHKADYVKKPKHYTKQDEKRCIICNIILGDEDTTAFEIYRSDKSLVFLNLYPYTSGHILVSPLRHITGFEELDPEELADLTILMQKSIEVLKHYGKTDSFNAGWNQGEWSGGSIKHFHAHLVPRYRTDINFIDIIGKSRTVLYSLESVQEKLLKYRDFFAGTKSLHDLSTPHDK